MRIYRLFIVTICLLFVVTACRYKQTTVISQTDTVSSDTLPYIILSADTTDPGCNHKEDDGCTQSSYSYPVFQSADTAVNNFLNAEVLSAFTLNDSSEVTPDEYNISFLREYLEYTHEMEELANNKFGWYQALNIYVICQEGKYISIGRDWDGYTGGAHGGFYSVNSNYDISKKRKIEMSEVLDIGNADLKKLGEKYFRKDMAIPDSLSLFEAGYFTWGDEELKIKEGEFYFNDNFAIDKTGISFFYNQYEIAPYVQGTAEFTIPYSELSPFLKIQDLLPSK